MKKIIQIPFEGFYQTDADSIIDNSIENELEDNNKNYDDIDFNHHNVINNKFAENYTSAFEEILNKEFDLDVSIKFKELTSPKEYNFETDKIFVEISQGDIQTIFKKIMGDPDLLELMGRTTKDLYQSRPGFASYYDSFVENFNEKSIKEWDENETYSLMATLGSAFEEESGSLVIHMDNWSKFEDVKDLARLKTNVAIKKSQQKISTKNTKKD
jgi:hypothetical protein